MFILVRDVPLTRLLAGGEELSRKRSSSSGVSGRSVLTYLDIERDALTAIALCIESPPGPFEKYIVETRPRDLQTLTETLGLDPFMDEAHRIPQGIYFISREHRGQRCLEFTCDARGNLLALTPRLIGADYHDLFMHDGGPAAKSQGCPIIYETLAYHNIAVEELMIMLHAIIGPASIGKKTRSNYDQQEIYKEVIYKDFPRVTNIGALATRIKIQASKMLRESRPVTSTGDLLFILTLPN